MKTPANIKIAGVLLILLSVFCLISTSYGAPAKAKGKKRILVVSSYHREYNWSKETNKGLCDAMLKFGYFDNKELAEEYTKNDYVETSKSVVKKLWMDTKRKSSKQEKAEMTAKIIKIAKEFTPDIILLGDDDAAEYIGQQFLDTPTPVVFWGVDNTPVKYGLIDNEEKPGHNVTGVYQSGYYDDSLKLLKTLVPTAKTFAIFTEDSNSGRSHYKAIEHLERKGLLPLKLIETVITNDFELWKEKALELQKKADAFFVVSLSTLKDKEDNHVPPNEVVKWHITHIKIPEASRGQFVKQGMLCSANDSGYNQGFEAVAIAHDILANSANPATYPPRTPKRGALMVNKQRAEMLGIKLTKEMEIEEYVEEASALKNAPK